MGKRSKQSPKSAPEITAAAVDRWPSIAPAILFGVALICYWVQMTSSSVSILWDAADFFQPIQNYLSQELHSGRMPFWAPYPSAGFPFLADPQVGAWYPLNWPFFLAGVTPSALFAEHWVAALIACFGAYLLAFRFTRHHAASALAGLCYGLSGFFTGHSSHTVILQTAAWLPWILWMFDRAIENGGVRDAAAATLIAGLAVLAGHFQSVLYCFLGLALFAAARLIASPSRWKRIVCAALAIPIGATLLSAIAVLPGLELAVNSIRTTQNAVRDDYGFLPLPALVTLFLPNYYGAASGEYHGPADITQYYFYSGFLLVPLAAWGMANRTLRLVCGLLLAATLWYMLGPSGGLFFLIGHLPGFANVRAPINGWFVPSLALALAAAGGVVQVQNRWRLKWIAPALLALFALDLFYCNFASNSLAYSRTPYGQLYGQGEDLFRRATAPLAPLMRFDSPQANPAFGPQAHYFDTRTEVTYGYNPLTLTRYHDYYEAMRSNPKLRNGVSGALWLDVAAGGVRPNPDAMPRVLFPRELAPAGSFEESRGMLATLDPAQRTIIPANMHIAAQDGTGMARVTEYQGGHYKIHYRCASESMLRVAGAYFDGWTAFSNGRTLPVFPADHAFLGILAPAGEGDITLDYRSTYFGAGAAITAVALAVCLFLVFRPAARQGR
jgi:hypothetical protein